jgi:hypothetical protein
MFSMKRSPRLSAPRYQRSLGLSVFTTEGSL